MAESVSEGITESSMSGVADAIPTAPTTARFRPKRRCGDPNAKDVPGQAFAVTGVVTTSPSSGAVASYPSARSSSAKVTHWSPWLTRTVASR